MKTHVVKTTPNAPLGEAVDLMDLYQVNGLPVVDDSEVLCGMLTERDVLRAIEYVAETGAIRIGTAAESAGEASAHAAPERNEQAITEYLLKTKTAAHLLVGNYMTQPAISLSEHATVHQAARLLLTSHLKRIPVTDEQGHVVGVINRVDVFQAIFEEAIL